MGLAVHTERPCFGTFSLCTRSSVLAPRDANPWQMLQPAERRMTSARPNAPQNRMLPSVPAKTAVLSDAVVRPVWSTCVPRGSGRTAGTNLGGGTPCGPGHSAVESVCDSLEEGCNAGDERGEGESRGSSGNGECGGNGGDGEGGGDE